MPNSVFSKMRLVAYERVTEAPTGFCTPLYSVPGKTNQLFAAKPLIEGDEESTIAEFYPVYQTRDVHSIPSSQSQQVAIGDPWTDVILIDGEPKIGNRAALRKALRHVSERCLDYPLTILNLFRNTPGEVRSSATSQAFERIRVTLGHTKAISWAIESYFRNHVSLILRRKLTAGNASSALLDAVRDLKINVDLDADEQIEIHFPDYVSDMSRTDLNIVLDVNDDQHLSSVLKDFGSTIGSLNFRIFAAEKREETPAPPDPITIVPIGKIASNSLRHAARNHAGERFIVDKSWPLRMVNFVRDDMLRTLDRPKLSQTSLVVAVIDERDPRYSVEALRELCEHVVNQLRGRLLLAPILPESTPSNILERRGAFDFLDNWPSVAILDTSFLRSPILTKDRKASLNRRTLDHAVKAGLLLISEPEVFNSLTRARMDAPDTLVTLDLKSEKDMWSEHIPEYASEAISAYTRPPRPLLRKHIIDSQASVGSYRSDATGVYDLSFGDSGQGSFRDLALAAIECASSEAVSIASRFAEPQQAFAFADQLDFPEAASVFHYGEPNSLKGIIVTGEAPRLDLLVRASRMGLQAIRYTDRRALRDALASKKSQRWEHRLPNELAPRKRIKSDRNSRLFRRAQETPAALIPQRDWDRWVSKHPDHQIIAHGLRVIPTGIRSIEQVGTYVAVSRNAIRSNTQSYETYQDFRQFVHKMDTGASEKVLMDEMHLNIGRGDVCNWAIRENRFPIVPRRLSPGDTVPRGWTVFSGDHYAAGAIASDLFEIWLRGHMPPPSQWGTRLPNEWVWDSFPWPSGFIIDQTHRAVFAEKPPAEFRRVVNEIDFPDLTVQFRDPKVSTLRKEIHPQLRWKLAQTLLPAYGISSMSSEPEVLTLLRITAGDNDAPEPMA